jgi:hypothetical protein
VLAALAVLLRPAAAQRAVCFRSGAENLVAVAADGYLHLAAGADLAARPDVAAPGVHWLTSGPGGRDLFGLRGDRVLRLDLAGSAWETLAELPQPALEAIAAPDGSPALVVLSGWPGDPVARDGHVWRLPLAAGSKPLRLGAVQDGFRPWRLWPSRDGDEPRFVVATYKATRFWPVEHRCMFVFSLRGETCAPAWLGSRLSRPYIAAAHADLRGDGRWRMISIEETEAGDRVVSVYAPIGFGYEGEWCSEPLPGVEEVTAFGATVLLWGHDGEGRPLAWRLLRDGDGYRLAAVADAPPEPAQVTLRGGELVGWLAGNWRRWPLLGARAPSPAIAP